MAAPWWARVGRGGSDAMIRLIRRILSAAMLVGIGVAALTGAAAPAADKPGMTYASLRDLPDFAGAWLPMTPMFVPEGVILPMSNALPKEVRPDVAARFAEAREKLMAGAPVDRGYCAPATFAGRLRLYAGGSLEILFNPGRVTIAVESGLVRRIYLRDAPPPDALDESRAGTSIAHWEGATLVVQTTGFSREAEFVPGIAIGRGASSVERISLRDPDTLEIESITTAPDILLAPLKATNLYRRAPNRLFTDFDTCVTGDRSFDNSSKTERFEATPPSDLPPPPAH